MNKIYALVLSIVLFITVVLVYDKLFYLHITVKFDDLEPLEKQMNVYYKGFKVGKTIKIYPDKNYLNTYLKIKIRPHNIKLPENIVAIIKGTPTSEYVSLKYPPSPSLNYLKDGITIEGLPSHDFKRSLNESIGNEEIDEIMDEATSLMESSTKTVKSLGQTFNLINELLEDINSDIKKSTSNLAKTTDNISSLTNKLDNAITYNQAKNSFRNIEQTTNNIRNMTQNLYDITEEIEEKTIPKINSIMCETDLIMENTKDITAEINQSIKNRKGLTRLLFGTKD